MDKIQQCAQNFLHLVSTTKYVFHVAKRGVKVLTLYSLNCDQTIRDMCRAREDAIRHENYMKRMLAEQEAALVAKDAEIARLKALLENNKNK